MTYRVALLLRWIAAATCVAGLTSGAARANDASARIGAGGIELISNRHVSMESEKLVVSPELVTVEYVFRNHSKRGVTTTIAFPLPVIDMATLEAARPPRLEDLRTGAGDSVNFVGFRAWVDDREIAPRVEQRALLRGRDVTTLFVEHDLPLLPWQSDAPADVAMRPDASPARWKPACDIGLFDRVEGDPIECEWDWPNWTVETTFHWEQVFRASATTRIRHVYTPARGEMFDLIEGPDASAYCIRPAHRRAAEIEPESGYFCMVEYILKTARTWRGPIGRFELTLTGARHISTCFEGLTETEPGTWSFTATNYVPRRNLLVGFCTDLYAASEPETAVPSTWTVPR